MKNKHILRRIVFIASSIVLGFLTAGIICSLMQSKQYQIDSQNMQNVIEVMIGVWGTLLGFLITAESILVTFSGGSITNEFKQTGHYMTVIYQYTQTSIKLLLYILIFIGIMIVDSFAMVEMFFFIAFVIMTVIDTLFCFAILILMLKMTTK